MTVYGATKLVIIDNRSGFKKINNTYPLLLYYNCVHQPHAYVLFLVFVRTLPLLLLVLATQRMDI